MATQGQAGRVVAVVGHAGSGKSALVAALGGAGSDGLVLLEGREAVPLADAVVFVLSSAQGMDPTLPLRWDEAGERDLPRLLCVTQLDLPRADFDESVAVAQRVLGEGVHPLVVPMLDDDEGVAGLLDLLDLHVADSSAGERVVRAPDPEHLGLVENLREDLLEAVLSGAEDDALFDAWMAGELPAADALRGELHAGVRGGRLHPVLAVTPDGIGAAELRALLLGAVEPLPTLPLVHDASGAARELSADPAGPLLARVSGPWVRVLSGTLHDGTEVVVEGVPSTVALRDLDGAPCAALPAGGCGRVQTEVDGLLSAAAEPLTADD